MQMLYKVVLQFTEDATHHEVNAKDAEERRESPQRPREMIIWQGDQLAIEDKTVKEDNDSTGTWKGNISNIKLKEKYLRLLLVLHQAPAFAHATKITNKHMDILW